MENLNIEFDDALVEFQEFKPLLDDMILKAKEEGTDKDYTKNLGLLEDLISWLYSNKVLAFLNNNVNNKHKISHGIRSFILKGNPNKEDELIEKGKCYYSEDDNVIGGHAINFYEEYNGSCGILESDEVLIKYIALARDWNDNTDALVYIILKEDNIEDFKVRKLSIPISLLKNKSLRFIKDDEHYSKVKVEFQDL